ncbi:MAG: hypothetical protein GY941_21650 [Planctomycetes bacterium]|nr:hypothetical protein [Planctomycetota bacterium]
MSESKTTVCNMSLARIGAKRINDYDDSSDTKLEAVYCRLFFDHTVRALQKHHYWPFAKSRAILSRDTVAPDFQRLYAYHLPSDFLRLILFYNGSDRPDGRTYYPHEIEGVQLLTDETSVYLKYIKNVTDVGVWDDLFIETMTLQLARKLVVPLSQSAEIKADIDGELESILKRVKSMDRMEETVIGRAALKVWQDARYSDIA